MNKPTNTPSNFPAQVVNHRIEQVAVLHVELCEIHNELIDAMLRARHAGASLQDLAEVTDYHPTALSAMLRGRTLTNAVPR